MKKKSTSKSAFFNLRVLIASVLCLFGVFVALLGSGVFAQTKSTGASQQPGRSSGAQDAPGTQKPEVVALIGPVHLADVRKLPYIAPEPELETEAMMRYPHGHGEPGAQPGKGVSGLTYVQRLLKNLWRPTPTMPAPILTFEGGAAAQFCACAPPDSDGDVGPNHYVEAINSAYAVYNKTGTLLAGPITYNTLFSHLPALHAVPKITVTHLSCMIRSADRWLISDFAFASFGGSPSFECVAISQTPDPSAGSWFLYAVPIDSDERERLPEGGDME